MPLNTTTQSTLDAARASFRAAAITFATSTVPPLASALASAQTAIATPAPLAPTGPGNIGDVNPPMFGNEADGALYLALMLYVRRLRASGAYTGAELPVPT